jgi:uncharacterized protein YggE
MRFSSLGRLGAVFIFGAFTTLTPLAAHADPAARTITVSGDGEIMGVPDQALLSAGVATIAPTADAALAANARKMTAVFDALKSMGVPERAIQTSNFSVQPQYTTNARGEPQRISGYQVSNQIDVTLDDNKKLGPVLDALIGVGANQINSIGFGIKNPEQLRTKAREAAIADARARAETYAKAAGVTVASVLSINENGGGMPMPTNRIRVMAGFVAPAETPTAAGEMSVTANVTMVFELK